MKPIRIDEYIPSIMEIVEKTLKGTRTCDTKLQVTWDISALFKASLQNPLVPNVEFTATAWVKLTWLVASVNSEVAWHMLVERPEPDRFRVTDILVYPQEVAGTAVDSNDEEYPGWLDTIPDDKFALLRGQGHSHVHMDVNPSAADTAFYSRLLPRVKDHYLFLIVNKRHDVWMNIYDVANNIVYEEKDIVFRVLDDEGKDMDYWLGAQKKMLKKLEGTKKVEPEPEGEPEEKPKAAYSTHSKKETSLEDYWREYREKTGYGYSSSYGWNGYGGRD